VELLVVRLVKAVPQVRVAQRLALVVPKKAMLSELQLHVLGLPTAQ
jgi:hypothetical protein